MSLKEFPRHVGFIPDGNRRWAVQRQLPKETGYANGIAALSWFRQQDRTLGG